MVIFETKYGNYPFGSVCGLIVWSIGSSIWLPLGHMSLKKSLTGEQLRSFETGVKYQMYHALLLLMLGFNMNFDAPLEKYLAYCLVIGTFSIFL